MEKHEEIYKIRHSLSHILAQAVQRTIDPQVQLGTGPAIEDGFYYDIQLSDGIEFKEDSLKSLQKTMEGICKEGQGFGSIVARDRDHAIEICNIIGQTFKAELVEKFAQADESAIYTFYYNYVDAKMLSRLQSISSPEYIAYYHKITDYISSLDSSLGDKFITFLDLCEGGHVDNSKDISDGCFKTNKIAGAYRQGKEGNPMMTRIYGRAFGSKDELKSHLNMLEEAKKRDHKKIGKDLNLFVFSDLVGPGLPLFTINGAIIINELKKFITEEKEKLGYTFVQIPHIAKRELYEKSGHMGKYDAMMPVMTDDEGHEYVMKAMNCPHHFELYNTQHFSYRDLPVRFAENTTCYRNEKSGELQGLTRVKALMQDDTHHFVRYDQIENEIKMILGLMENVYSIFGFTKFKVEISVRDSKDKSKYFGSDELWNQAETVLIETVKKWGVEYSVEEGEAAFYGPKIDIRFSDAIGRTRQLTTVQLDFNQPENFDMTYISQNGSKERPAVLHVAILGSVERFMGVMIEHFAGDFPLWLTPEQIRIVPVADVFADYAYIVQQACRDAGLRSKIDSSSDSFSKKIRNAELDKVYYTIIVGEKEVAEQSVSIRNIRSKEQYTISLQDFIQNSKQQYISRSLS